MKKFCTSILVVGLLANTAWAQDPSPNDLAWLRGECGDGALAYQADDPNYKIYLTELSTGQTVEIGPGTRPEFSPDSSKLAWLDGSTAKGRMRVGDGSIHTIATGVTQEGGVHWVSNTELVLVKSGQWVRVSLLGEENSVPALTALGTGGTECDVKMGSDGVWSYVTGTTWKTSDGGEGGTGGSCSCSLSPDGKSVTGLEHDHKVCSLTQIRTGGVSGQLNWVYDYTGEKGFDNQRWSSNDGSFVTMQDEKFNYMVVMKVGGNYCTRMGQSSVGEMYGDFTVGDGSGAPWPGTEVEPVLLLTPDSLTFNALQGGANPDPKEVQVQNAGQAILADVTVDADQSWLSVTVSGSGNSQVLSNQVDIAGLSEGLHQAVVEVVSANALNSPQSYDVSLVVSLESLTHMKINCGDDAWTPPGWDNDGPYLQGGEDFVFSESFATTGVADAAPADVYRTCRHRIFNVENVCGYDFAALPDGDYRILLHFGDAFGPRAIDVWIEGAEVISDLDIATEAGGTYLALVKELAVLVDDGNGLQIELTDDRAEPSDFFVNGIEIISVTQNQAPEVDAGLPQLIQLGRSVFLDGTITDDGPVTSSWTKVSGPGSVTFVHAENVDTEAQIDAAGEYVLRLTADDGALQAFDEVTITVTEQPAIVILAPTGGEVWAVGSTQQIRWSTVNLSDIQIDYSPDDGLTWKNIVGTVDTEKPAWGDFAWTVPDDPSTSCRIKITGYFGEAPTISDGLFEIRRFDTEDDVEGGCGCDFGASAAGGSLWLALFVLLLLRRRS